MQWLKPDLHNVTLAEGQDEYETIHVRREVATVAHAGGGPDYMQLSMVARLRPTPEELARLNAGEDLFVRVAGNAWPPMLVCVGDPNPEVNPYGRPQPNPDD